MNEKINFKEESKKGSKSKYYKTDAIRGYLIPPYAVAGCSYTGEYEDSPCKVKEVKPEIDKLREYLKQNGITDTHIVMTPSSNVFMQKIWITSPEEYEKALDLANDWLNKNEFTTTLIHEASEGEEMKHTPKDQIYEISDKEWEDAVKEPEHLKVMSLQQKHQQNHLNLPLLNKAEEPKREPEQVIKSEIEPENKDKDKRLKA